MKKIKNSKDCFKSKNGVYIIAEIGGNHEGNFEYAQELTRLAAESGADAIKYQIYSGDTLVNPVISPDRNKHFKKFELDIDEYINLAKLCDELDVSFMASIWDEDSIDLIDDFIEIYKIGSGDMADYRMLKSIAAKKKPIILSTGLATIDEVLKSIDFIRSCDESFIDEKKLALLQCTSMYPIPDEDTNLNAMVTLREATGLPVGYSDHTVGSRAVEIAAAMGAAILEVHFTDSREGKSFRDHHVSFTAAEIRELIDKIVEMDVFRGGYEKKPVRSEIESGHLDSFRRAVYPAKDIAKGTVISEEHLTTLRPNRGIDARNYFDLVGKKIKIDLKKYQQLEKDYFENI
ncbi:N-acetylneuraminate synthase family protein [Elusimicrobiota bacterium]